MSRLGAHTSRMDDIFRLPSGKLSSLRESETGLCRRIRVTCQLWHVPYLYTRDTTQPRLEAEVRLRREVVCLGPS